jgi:aminopeptidase
MDPRIENHARIIVDHSTSIEPGDEVLVDAPPAADDLVTALYELIGDVGANVLTVRNRTADRFNRAYLRNHDGEFEHPAQEAALVEEMDVYVAIRGNENVTETSDVDPATRSEYDRVREPIREERLSKRWCLTQYPSPAYAQLAEMSTEAYENFVWEAVNKDWDAQREHQAQLLDILEGTDEIRIQSGDTTDVSMRIGGNDPINDYGENNLPGGEVFTAPVPDSVEGEVLFDKPLYHQGREIDDVYLQFEGGEVIDHRASKNEDVLTETLNTDDGARRLGELGIGMNRDIDRFTYNILFDEKMGDTVHMAVGMAYEDNVGEGVERNESAVHVDMIVDMAEDSRIEADGEVIQRDGRFVFEDGFDTGG